MNNTKLLAVDMDGTLFDDDKNISKENLNAITKMLDKAMYLHLILVDLIMH